jgi:hypothetical protein
MGMQLRAWEGGRWQRRGGAHYLRLAHALVKEVHEVTHDAQNAGGVVLLPVLAKVCSHLLQGAICLCLVRLPCMHAFRQQRSLEAMLL